jgi:protocatechuate 4,5-dioxygenase beta chain
MAKIVAGFGVPHNPGNPEAVRKGATEIGALYGKIAEEVRRAELDALVVFSSDHMNTFFLDNLPIFAVGVTDQSAGPNDGTLMPRYDVPVHEALAGHVRKSGLRNSFDLAVSQEFELDHTFMVPLHFLTPGLATPIVPVFIAGIVAPLPESQRCLQLGQMVAEAVAAYPEDLRVGVLASGSFSLDVGGNKGARETFNGFPDPAWMNTVMECLDTSDVDRLVAGATAEQMDKAGNVAGEILNWIAAIGAMDRRKPAVLEPLKGRGEAWGAWRLD